MALSALGISIVTVQRWENSTGPLVLRSTSMESLLTLQEKLLSGQR